MATWSESDPPAIHDGLGCCDPDWPDDDGNPRIERFLDRAYRFAIIATSVAAVVTVTVLVIRALGYAT